MLSRALLATSLGLLALIAFLLFTAPLPVSTSQDLDSLTINQKLSTESTVISEKTFSSERRITLANGIEIRCSCPNSSPFKNKRIQVIGTYQRFRNQSWIEAHVIRVLEFP